MTKLKHFSHLGMEVFPIKKIRELKNRVLRREFALLIIILLISLVIRWRDIENIPYGVENDEFSWIATSLFHQHNILASEKGVWSLHDTSAQRFPVSIVINQISFKLFGTDFLSPRKILTLVHIVSLIFFYLLARKFITSNGALLITLLYSFSAYKLIASRIVGTGVFSELFVYPALLLLLSINPKNLIRSFIYTFISGISILLSILTSNLAYILPFVSIATILFTVVIKKISIKLTILLIILFLLPLILFYQKWFIGINGEVADKSYALVNKTFDLKEKKLYTNHFIGNITTAKEQLFNSLKYSTGDMFILFPGSLVNSLISWGFILGAVSALFNFKKYFILVVWLFTSAFTYQIILGLLYPRMWILTVGLIHLFAGIAIDKIYKIGSKQKAIQIIIWGLFLASSSYIIYSELSLYYKYAIYNPSFLISHREVIEITKKWRGDLGKNVLFIAPEGIASPTNINTIHTATSFMYLISNPGKADSLKQYDRAALGVLTKHEFISNIETFLSGEKVLVIDNTILSDMEKELKQNNSCNYSTIPYRYFTELEVHCPFVSKRVKQNF